MKSNLLIVTPELSEAQPLSEGLRELTRALSDGNLAELNSGLFGGEFGYGADYQNDVFNMRAYCWCEQDDCPWCCGCTCPDEAFAYLIDGEPVDFEEWVEVFERATAGLEPGSPSWEEKANQVNKRRQQMHLPRCEFCLEGGPAKSHGGGPGTSAPNFWHPASGFKVWWYKYIGRGMEVSNPTQKQWADVLTECLSSLPLK